MSRRTSGNGCCRYVRQKRLRHCMHMHACKHARVTTRGAWRERELLRVHNGSFLCGRAHPWLSGCLWAHNRSGISHPPAESCVCFLICAPPPARAHAPTRNESRSTWTGRCWLRGASSISAPTPWQVRPRKKKQFWTAGHRAHVLLDAHTQKQGGASCCCLSRGSDERCRLCIGAVRCGVWQEAGT